MPNSFILPISILAFFALCYILGIALSKKRPSQQSVNTAPQSINQFFTGVRNKVKTKNGIIFITAIILLVLFIWAPWKKDSKNESQKEKFQQSSGNQGSLPTSNVSVSDWPDSVKCVPLQLGEQKMEPGVWYVYERDTATLFYSSTQPPSKAILVNQKLGAEKNIYVRQYFNDYGYAVNDENECDGSDGKWYLTVSDSVTVRITGTINNARL